MPAWGREQGARVRAIPGMSVSFSTQPGPAGRSADWADATAGTAERSFTDAELMAGPAERFSALFDRHARRLFGYCARRVGPDTAEDVVAETFLIAFQRRGRYDGRQPSVLPWLCGIATNLLRRHRRDELRALRAVARTGVDPLSSATGVSEGHAERSAERADAQVVAPVIAAALAAMPRRQREVLLLFAVAELQYGEIATALGIPLGSVQSALHRARARLRDALTAHVHSPSSSDEPEHQGDPQ
jgi:RNA polymerase sigma factor (sigma-70 family)